MRKEIWLAGRFSLLVLMLIVACVVVILFHGKVVYAEERLSYHVYVYDQKEERLRIAA